MINLFRIITFSFVMSGRIQPNDDIAPDEKPKFGFYWWFWIPEINHNGAKLSDPDQCFDISILFLCFSVGFILWPMSNHAPKEFNFKLFYGLYSKDLVWVRVALLKWGFSIKRTTLLFSERYGYTWYLPLKNGWRLTILKAKGA